MSLHSVTASAKRAVQSAAPVSAKRGDLVVFPTYHSTTFIHGATEREERWNLGVVASVRDGIASSARLICGGTRTFPNTGAMRLIVAKTLLAVDGNHVLAELRVAHPDDVRPTWPTLDALRTELRQFVAK